MPAAVKTLAAIEQAMVSDQGAKFRGLLRQTIPLAEDAYSEKESDFRGHLGASVIGTKCARDIWYSYRWASLVKFEGRMLRLFNRGHLEEARMIALLMLIGCTVYTRDSNGKQFRIPGHKDGQYGGSLDAVVTGCPDIPNYPLLAEFKTHNEKQFYKLIEEGLLKAKWEHFVQMQQYMGETQLSFGLYMATNKNTDQIHAELIAFDQSNYFQFKHRAIQIIDAETPPPRISNNPAWFECKFCDHNGVCHKKKTMPARTCRTCVHSRPDTGTQWLCTNKLRRHIDVQHGDNVPLSEADQLKACEHYEMIPEIKS